MALINPLLGSNLVSGAAPFDTTIIPKSVWLDGSADGLTAASSEFSAQDGKEFTLGTWFQLNELGVTGALFCAGDVSAYTSLRHAATNKIIYQTEAGSAVLESTSLYRDVGWYHLLLSVDTTQAIASDRVKLFINGIQEPLTGTQPALNHVYEFNTAVIHEVGDSPASGTFEGYMAQSFMIGSKSIQQGDFAITNFVDSFTFGTNGSQFVPKSMSNILTLVDAGSNNSFLLKYENSSALGTDSSTNTISFTATSMAAVNQSENTPSNVHAVMDILKNDGGSNSTITFAEGNLRVTGASGSDGGTFSTLPLATSGTTEFQSTWNNGDGIVGIAAYDNLLAVSNPTNNVVHGVATNYNASYGYQEDGDNIITLSSGMSRSSQGDAMTNGSVLTVRYNADDNELTFLKDNVVQGSAISTVAGLTYYAFACRRNNYDITMHFDQGKFPHTIGTGNKVVNSKNLATPDFQGIDFFDSTLYEGNGKGQRVGDFVPFTDSETVANSIIFNDDDAAHLTRTYVTPTASTAFTFSCWFKIGSSGLDQYLISTGTDNASEGYIALNFSTGGGQIWIADPNDGAGFGARANALFIDPSQWYHLCVGVDTTASSGSRVKLEVNGIEHTLVTLFGSATEPSASQSMNLNEGNAFTIGRRHRTSTDLFDGYLANVFFIDGQKKVASDFGQVDTSTNRWIPKAYTGTFGNNGYKLAFGTAPGTGSGAGTDTSGEGHNWTENNFTASDQMIDTPTKNFTTFDPGYSGGGSNVWTEGNTKVQGTDGSLSDASTTTFGMTGKVVFQFQVNTVASDYPQCGFITSQAGLEDINATSGSIQLGTSSVAGSFKYDAIGNFFIPAGPESTTFGSVSSLQALDADDVLRYEIDTDTGTIKVFFQNEGSGSFTEITGARVTNFPFDPIFGVRPAVSNFNNSIVTLQTGGQTTLSSVTTDFKEINQDNLDDTVSKITAWAWIKNKDSTDNHILVDRVRGIGEVLGSNSNAAEVTNDNSVQRFLQRGVKVGTEAAVNTATESYVLWQWLLGDSASTGATLTGGSPDIASTGIVASAGHFSVAVYSGSGTDDDDISHGLGGTIEMLMVKHFAADTDDWMVWHKDLPTDSHQLHLNTNDSADTTKNSWGSNPVFDANVFRVGVTDETNKSSTGNSHVFYAFRSIPGVCKVGSYEGSGNVDGSYIITGFKPAWLMLKSVDSTSNWQIFDSRRNGFNVRNNELKADDTATEDTSTDFLDLLADGFKMRIATDPNVAESYIYIAMADIGGNGTLPPILGR